MATTVRTIYASMFRDITGKAEEVVRLEKPQVRELIDYLSRVYGKKFRDLIMDAETGDITVKGGIFISVGGQRISLNDKLSEGDIVAFLMGMAGG